MVSETTPMVLALGHSARWALDQSALLEVLDALKAAEVNDRIRQAAEMIYQALIEAELGSVIGALPYERSAARTAHRSGHRLRVLASAAGDLELRIPKLRAGSFFPSLLERRRVDQSLLAVIMEGLSARHLHPQGPVTWSRRWVPTAGSPSPRSAGSARTWTPRWPCSVTAACPPSGSRMGCWTRLTARRGWITGWSPRPWPCRPAWPPMGTGRCWGSRSVTARTRVLDRVLALFEDPQPLRGAAGHLRRRRRAQERDRQRADRRRLATLPVHFLRNVLAAVGTR